MAIFPTLNFLGNIGQENVFCDILERENAFLGYKNKKLEKSKNWHFSKGVNTWFWSKNGHFSNFYFSGNIGQKNMFYDILEWKNGFLGYKIKKFFQLYFLGNVAQENVFYHILKRKKAFQDYKNKKFKKSKNWHFFKGVTHGLAPTMAILPTFIF